MLFLHVTVMPEVPTTGIPELALAGASANHTGCLEAAHQHYTDTYCDEWKLGWLALNEPNAPELSGYSTKQHRAFIDRMHQIDDGRGHERSDSSDSARTVFHIDEELPASARRYSDPTPVPTAAGADADADAGADADIDAHQEPAVTTTDQLQSPSIVPVLSDTSSSLIPSGRDPHFPLAE